METNRVVKVTKKERKSIPAKIKAELQKEVNSCCPFCANEEVGHFEIHHIDKNPSNNLFENLILVCPICYSKITKNDILPNLVIEKKIELSQQKNTQRTNTKNTTNFNAPVKQAIVGDNNNISNNITVNNITKKAIKLENKYPEGCIGADNDKANYISYLVARYHEYKMWEVGKENMNYKIFLSKVKTYFNIGQNRTIYHISNEKFEILSNYIQKRINNTVLAKTREKTHKNYSSFEEWLRK